MLKKLGGRASLPAKWPSHREALPDLGLHSLISPGLVVLEGPPGTGALRFVAVPPSAALFPLRVLPRRGDVERAEPGAACPAVWPPLACMGGQSRFFFLSCWSGMRGGRFLGGALGSRLSPQPPPPRVLWPSPSPEHVAWWWRPRGCGPIWRVSPVWSSAWLLPRSTAGGGGWRGGLWPRGGGVSRAWGDLRRSFRSMFLDLKSSLAGIDAKLDHLTEQMDRIRARVDKHDACFEQLESRTSELEDQGRGGRERLLQMKRVLEVIRNKNEDLEARSWCNNVRTCYFSPLKLQWP
ncbi:hypothetical protein NDU88_001832 [Pleurodeles waltl]|uniref:Uncharacterized protein n=1 Tax=Pleurodeles waltl TaxID=8319 RepID=A0AAV7KSZ3_PLEWA|nr:hypothetical protein NDU88_001832 [Pleurodeles waltl]